MSYQGPPPKLPPDAPLAKEWNEAVEASRRAFEAQARADRRALWIIVGGALAALAWTIWSIA